MLELQQSIWMRRLIDNFIQSVVLPVSWRWSINYEWGIRFHALFLFFYTPSFFNNISNKPLPEIPELDFVCSDVYKKTKIKTFLNAIFFFKRISRLVKIFMHNKYSCIVECCEFLFLNAIQLNQLNDRVKWHL